MQARCPECNGLSVWDDAVGSAVCTSCGTLTDPSQSVLTSVYDFHGEYDNPWRNSHAGTPRPSQSSSTWALANQGKEAREKKNSNAIAEFVKSLSLSLNASGLSPRAITLFNQAKTAISFRWGRKAKLVAGACLAIALRESNRPDCLHDIAYLMQEPLFLLTRAFHSVRRRLSLDLTSTGPAAYIPIIHNFLSSLVQDHVSELPSTLAEELSHVSLQAVNKTAESLSHVVARIGPAPLIKYPAPSIACAVYILSLESEMRGMIKQLSSLAEVLGARLHVAKTVVMSCYKVTQDVLASLAENVPWLDKYQGEKGKGRSKLAKRVVVARAMKDVIAFHEDSWMTTVKPVLTLENEEDEHKEDDASSWEENDGDRVRKNKKTRHTVQDAVQFLLDPASGPIPCTADTSWSCQQFNSQSTTRYPLASYFLSGQAPSHHPTRLQLLSASRGGAEEISDEELFEDGELESLMRSEKEMVVLRRALQWDQGEEGHAKQQENEEMQVASPPKTQNSGKWSSHDTFAPNGGKRSRINYQALARFMNDEVTVDSDVNAPSDKLAEDRYEDEGVPVENMIHIGSSAQALSNTPDEVIVADWRPLSPVNAFLDYNNWYEEDYSE